MTCKEAYDLGDRLSRHMRQSCRVEVAYVWGKGRYQVVIATESGISALDSEADLRLFARLRTGRGIDETR